MGDDVDQINALIDSDKAINLKIVGVVKPVQDARRNSAFLRCGLYACADQ